MVHSVEFYSWQVENSYLIARYVAGKLLIAFGIEGAGEAIFFVRQKGPGLHFRRDGLRITWRKDLAVDVGTQVLGVGDKARIGGHVMSRSHDGVLATLIHIVRRQASVFHAVISSVDKILAQAFVPKLCVLFPSAQGIVLKPHQ